MLHKNRQSKFNNKMININKKTAMQSMMSAYALDKDEYESIHSFTNAKKPVLRYKLNKQEK